MEATSDPSAPSGTDSGVAARVPWALGTAAALGIALGCYDLTVSIVQHAPAALGNAAALAAPLAVSAGAFFLACFVPLLLVTLAGGQSARKVPLMAALAVALGCFGALCIYFNLTRTGLDPWPRQTRLLVGCLAAALGIAVYQRLRRDAGLEFRRFRFPSLALVLVAAAGLALAWVRAYLPSRVAGPAAIPLRSDHAVHRIILLSVDTLRRDAVSALSPGSPATPAIDALARDSVVFERAYSPAPWTLPAFVSMMTGVPPAVHGVRTPKLRIPETLPTLAEKLRDAGYRTAAIGHNPWLRPEHGMARGFLGYDICPRDEHGSSLGSRILARLEPMRLKPSLTTPELTDLAISWVRAHRREDFFLWVHYLKPHGPYEPPPAYRPHDRPPEGMGYSFGSAGIRTGSRVLTAAQRPWVRQLYDGEVRFVDDNLARFLAELQRLGIYDDTLIIFVSDHGEEFWEHGGCDHGHSLYDEVTRVPMFFKLPGAREGRRRSDLVTTGSLMPTLLDLIGEPAPPESSSYGSLRSLLDGSGEWIPRPVMSSALLYFEERQSAVFEDFKYVRTPGSRSEAIFDLATDPREQHDIAASSPDRLRLGRAAFAEQERRCLALRDHFGIRGSFATELKPEAIEQLRSLGYVQ
ncbi:MAG TPA: sulfatase [Candidatus Polarisedimenticolia bacterium]|nr:sulfatase [Candidatus Polarisedimenticolia bacterium]